MLLIPQGPRSEAKVFPSATAPALLALYVNPAVTKRLNAAMDAMVMIWLVRKSELSMPSTSFLARGSLPACNFPVTHPRRALAASSKGKKDALTPTTAVVLMANVVAQPGQLDNMMSWSSDMEFAE